MPRFTVPSGPSLHFEDAGSGPPVLLVHGWSASSAVFADEMALLARSHRVIAPDLRGHGRSDPGAPFALDDLARDLAAIAGALALERAVIVGWSLGALVALAALPHLRGRVTAIALVAGTPRFTTGDGWAHGLSPRSVEALARRVRRDAARAVARFFDGMFAGGETEGEAGERIARVRSAIPAPDGASALAGLDVLAREDLRSRLCSVDVPALLLHGERDPICPVGASREMAAAIPGARLATIEGAGHAPFLSRPVPCRAALTAFLGERA